MFEKISILQLTGILLLDYDKCKRKTISSLCCLSVCFHAWIIFAFISNMTFIPVMLSRTDFTIALSSAFANSVCLAIFIILWLKRRQILKLMKTIQKIPNSGASKNFNFIRMFQVFNIFLFLLYPVIFINLTFSFFDNILSGLNFLTFMYAYIFYSITFPLSVTLIY